MPDCGLYIVMPKCSPNRGTNTSVAFTAFLCNINTKEPVETPFLLDRITVAFCSVQGPIADLPNHSFLRHLWYNKIYLKDIKLWALEFSKLKINLV
jgi:hypothetical protein